MIQDLSYSGIVNHLQGDKQKAKKMLVEVAHAEAKAQKEAFELYEQYEKKVREIDGFVHVMQSICKHINLAAPFTLMHSSPELECIDVSEDFKITIRKSSL